MTTQSNESEAEGASPLKEFIEGVCESDPFKVERDLGQGYVKLCSTEAEKRQAAQDITCIEDAVIELLRNSRDAGATNVFIATAKEEGRRTLVVLDDGCGVPSSMREAVFEPRVTSKLETAHIDKWGLHGRGMALYSIRVNAETACISASEVGRGCAMKVVTTASLPERADQSTFPTFEEVSGVMAMRGPKNILRTACEFVLEHRDEVTVYVGSPAQIAATLYEYGLATVPAYARAFGRDEDLPYVKELGVAHSPEDFVQRAQELGLEVSLRTARRILDGQSESVEDLATLMARRSFKKTRTRSRDREKKHLASSSLSHVPHLDHADKAQFLASVMDAYGKLAEAYYLDEAVQPKLRLDRTALHIEIPLLEMQHDES